MGEYGGTARKIISTAMHSADEFQVLKETLKHFINTEIIERMPSDSRKLRLTVAEESLANEGKV